ncbi:MAG: [protein-PII] uridylyltransferase [Hyphomicrobiaceae bacterium]
MDHQKTAIAEPFFDPTVLRQELTALFNDHGDASMARSDILTRLKELKALAHERARHQLVEDGDGRRCASSLSQFYDALISLIFDYTTAHVYRATNPSDAERMAVVATGGYGRGLLAPGSDIDLLFLLPYKQTPWGESVVEYVLYMLWDLGLKVGHATRTVEQCVRLGGTDYTIRTSLLDIRLILGEAILFEDLQSAIQEDMTPATIRAFVDAKMEERDERHAKSGDARYRVEPNIKDGKGGLRDLHTLHWLSQIIYREDVGEPLVAKGVFTEEEVATFRRCEDFLWTVRCYLHFVTKRAEERLTFEVQPEMAELLGYKEHGGLRAVERFMKHYFLTAKDVGDLTTILCGTLEMMQLKETPGLKKFLNPLSWGRRNEVSRSEGFFFEHDRLNVHDEDVFKRDPVNVLKYFLEAAKTESFLHPNAIRILRAAPRAITDKVRKSPKANKIFLELLTETPDPATTLRRMNESGVLGRFMPEFRRVVGMMQFNMYHHYTVDEHLIRTVAMLSDIEHGGSEDEVPLSTELFKTIKNRRVLFVAALLHDIGKGSDEDHSVVGARLARKICPRLGLTQAECDTVVWLIAEHLTMSNIAQSRDITDPKTIKDFAAIVQSPERLKLLLLLTVSDIRAVGPGTWNGWKGQLLRTLYYETEPTLAGGHSTIARSERVAMAQDELREKLKDWASDDINNFVERFYPDYWLRFDADKIALHADLLRRADRSTGKLFTDATTDAFTAVTELTIFAPNHPRLLSLFAGACAASGANIVGASITSTRDGFALDSFLLQRELGEDTDEIRRTKNIGEMIDRLLQGKGRLKALLERRRPGERRVEAFDVEPEVYINNKLSDNFTVIEVAGLDRAGLLYDLTTALSDLYLDISSAHITTFGEKAVDVFYVTDLTNKKIENESRQETIRERLVEVLQHEDDNAMERHAG